MGKKHWLSMHPRNLVLRKSPVRRTYVRPPLHVSRGEIFLTKVKINGSEKKKSKQEHIQHILHA